MSQAATATTTAGSEFPVTWNGELPSTINPDTYRLKIDGDIPSPLELKLEELYVMPSVQKTIAIRCVEGWIAHVPWEGIPLSYLLQQAGSSPKSIAHVTISATTGYSTTLNSGEVANLDHMIALKVGGVPLTIDHGYPARLVRAFAARRILGEVRIKDYLYEQLKFTTLGLSTVFVSN